jgi:hypothetical protein
MTEGWRLMTDIILDCEMLTEGWRLMTDIILDCEMLISQESWKLKSCKCKPNWYDN